jgi:hypothetical protein
MRVAPSRALATWVRGVGFRGSLVRLVVVEIAVRWVV